jgi:hypothetical protein
MMMLRVALATFLVAMNVTHGECATVVLSAAADASIFQNNVNNASGGGNGLFSGANTSGFPRRALISFDVSGRLPVGATIESVELTLVLGDVSGAGARPLVDIAVHRVLASWGEAATQQQTPPNDNFSGIGQGSPALEGDVTWNARFFSATAPILWSTPGGDFNSVASTSASIPTALNTSYTFPSSSEMVSDVQSWLDNPASNYGWLLKGVNETLTSSLRGFYSSDVATASFHPQLNIMFSAPSPAADFNGDGKVDGADFDTWKANLGNGEAADADGDGDSDGADFLVWQREVGMISAPPASPVPEPDSMSLLVVVVLFTLGRKRW